MLPVDSVRKGIFLRREVEAAMIVMYKEKKTRSGAYRENAQCGLRVDVRRGAPILLEYPQGNFPDLRC